MKVEVWAMGKLHESFYQEGMAYYRERVSRYLEVHWREWQLPKARRHKDANIQKAREADLLTEHMHASDRLILLDEGGNQMDSKTFAQWLETQYPMGAVRLIFLIGGAYGFHTTLYQRAWLKISLGPLTFPHQLARLIFAEQLYRAQCIRNGLPYHH